MKKTISIVIIITVNIICYAQAFASSPESQKAQKEINDLAMMAVETVGYGIAIFYTIKEAIALIPRRDVKEIVTMVVKYAAIYWTLHKLTWIYDLVGAIWGRVFS